MCVSTEAGALALKSAAAVFTLCLMLTSLAHSGPVTVDPPAALAATVPEQTSATGSSSRLPSIPAQARSVDGYQVRCWQHGKSVIDEFRAGAMPEGPKLPEELLRLPSVNGDRGGTISARNATCFIKPQSRTTANSVPSLP
jgi:hypothetical protein